jgi:phosphate transport system ATP-binding protein
MTISPAALDNGTPALLPEIIVIRSLNLFYGDSQALNDINAAFKRRTITALIGPSGCGKSTLLRTLNRMNDLIAGVRLQGEVVIDGQDIFAPGLDLTQLRKKVGMVFQRPNPFPLSIYDNVVYGPRLHGRPRRAELEAILTQSLAAVELWDEVKDRLQTPALALTEEQQQRLCIARLLAVEPEILLMDEPCSALGDVAHRADAGTQTPRVHHHHHLTCSRRPGPRTNQASCPKSSSDQPHRPDVHPPQGQSDRDYITGKYS